MNLSTLISTRQSLIEQTRLANTAYAYVTLQWMLAVARRAGLGGALQVQQPNEAEERYWAALIPHGASQAVVDEHFSDEDAAAFADALAFVTGISPLDLVVRLDELEGKYLHPLAIALERAGVRLEEKREHPRGPAWPDKARLP